MADGDGFSFPVLPPPGPKLPRVPLTARATVVERTGGASVVERTGGAGPAGSGDATGAAMPPPQPRPAASPAGIPQKAGRPGKVPLEKGYSQVDWLRLTRTEPDLAGLKGGPMRRNISLEEVKQHRTQDDCWMVVNGKVYNATPYIRFHPGGVKYIMMGAGRDATALFNKYHAWVNIDFMMSKCMVGLLEPPSERSGAAASGRAGAASSPASQQAPAAAPGVQAQTATAAGNGFGDARSAALRGEEGQKQEAGQAAGEQRQ